MKYIFFNNLEQLPSRSFTCGYCSETISSENGYCQYGEFAYSKSPTGRYIYQCHSCGGMTFFDGQEQYPKPKIGKHIDKLPEDIERVYEEIRSCYQVAAYTSVVLLGRKLLMHIACEDGAKEGESFTYYVDFLKKGGYVNKNMTRWLDVLRKRGNKATHKIERVEQGEAEELFNFIQMFLQTIYQFALSDDV